ncbi:MAG: T9SS type A sorting domain-containing protein [Elusimicrobia bacterium]|nr:T9SS type A sorting domain-containing protein [Elusimicrobiota bacterium]
MTINKNGLRALALAAAVFGLAALWQAGRLCALILAGGALVMPYPFFSAAGGGPPLSGGSISLASSVGQVAITPMSAGGLQIIPGGVAAQPPARLDLDTARAFPTPFKPTLGHDRITFRGLTPNATIRIYTIAGELVQTLTKNDPTTADFIWYPVANSSGQRLASGVYLYAIQGDSGKKTGKLMVIK